MKRSSTTAVDPTRQTRSDESGDDFVNELKQKWEHLQRLIPVKHWSESQVEEDDLLSISSQETIICNAVRALSRNIQRHVVIQGEPGTGRTSILQQLGMRLVQPGVRNRRVEHTVYLDATNVGPEDSRGFLESLLMLVADPEKRTVVLIDGIASLVVRSQGRSNHALLGTLLRLPMVSIVGSATHQEYVDHFGSDVKLLSQFECLVMEPLPTEDILAITLYHLSRLEKTHRIEFDRDVAERAIAFTDKFILSENQPRKTVNIIQRVFEDRAFDISMGRNVTCHITSEDVAQAISQRSHIPLHTILGRSNETDYQQVLEDAIFGQEEAVRQTSIELQMIAAGLCEPCKPASVMMFAGTTGVGKTELAKRIAQLYSSTGLLKIYPMGNFTESHSVSGLIGVPPGYVGHEHGGQLVSDLLADPFSVFLLDEAEKCHPNVWKPFLNLFDEGWVIDQLGRKAYADRAIFILTTNAGDRSISQLSRSGKSMDEVAQQVRKTLSRVRQERSSQPVFPPQFLSRIRRILVFSPLEEDGLIRIAQRARSVVADRWLTARGKEIQITDEVVTAIGERGNGLNQLVNGEEGGRIVAKLFRDHVEYAVLSAAIESPNDYECCRQIRVELASRTDATEPQVKVRFLG